MTLDEAYHRLFVGCRIPGRLLVFDTESGKTVVSLETGSSDDMFYDASKLRIYVISRDGFIEAFQQQDADHYGKLARYPIAPGSGTGFFVPEWGKLISFRTSPRASRLPRSLCTRQNEADACTSMPESGFHRPQPASGNKAALPPLLAAECQKEVSEPLSRVRAPV
jgi:hypothetical protein